MPWTATDLWLKDVAQAATEIIDGCDLSRARRGDAHDPFGGRDLCDRGLPFGPAPSLLRETLASDG